MSRLYPGTQLKFNIGDLVHERDGRHVGEVIAAFLSTVRIKHANGHKEDLNMDDVVLFERRARAPYLPPMRPRTVVESPRARLERSFRGR